jgi:glutamyl-tRNA synthetase
MDTVRVRFAPSPTGYLHIGGARTALYNWLFARKYNGVFVLRIEDTDFERSTEDSIAAILDGLTWLGLTWDEGPYFQSERISEHQEAAQKLLQSGHAYKCFCTKAELETKRKTAQSQKLDYKYDRTCRGLSDHEINQKEEQGMPHVVRFKVPDQQGVVAFQDNVCGLIEKKYRDIEDFVILRSDHNPLYVLSNAVDDNLDRISHVIRGQDGLANTPKQILLYQALGFKVPVFAHMSLTLDTKKAKISKRRHGDVVTVSYYRERGFLPWALCNFLALLGWSTSDDQEFFTREQLIDAFSLEGMVRHNSIFNYFPGDAKNWTDPKAVNMNARYLSMLNIEELLPYIREELRSVEIWDEAFDSTKREWFEQTLDMIRTRFHTLKDFATKGRCYFADDFPFETAAIKKNLKRDERIGSYLKTLAHRLEVLDIFDTEAAENVIRDLCQSLGIKPGLLINAVRTAITGQAAGPGLFDILETMGKERTVTRLRKAAELLEQGRM